MRTPGGSSTPGDDRVEAVGRGAKRHAHRQVGADGRRRSRFSRSTIDGPSEMVDIGHGRKRHRVPVAVAPAARRSGPDPAVSVVQPHAHRDQTVVDGQFRQGRIQIADGGHAHGLAMAPW
jgi:hypothetical protein